MGLERGLVSWILCSRDELSSQPIDGGAARLRCDRAWSSGEINLVEQRFDL